MAEIYTYKIDWRLCEHSAVVFAIRNEDFYCSNDSKLFSRFAIHSSHSQSAYSMKWLYNVDRWMNEWMAMGGGFSEYMFAYIFMKIAKGWAGKEENMQYIA